MRCEGASNGTQRWRSRAPVLCAGRFSPTSATTCRTCWLCTRGWAGWTRCCTTLPFCCAPSWPALRELSTSPSAGALRQARHSSARARVLRPPAAVLTAGTAAANQLQACALRSLHARPEPALVLQVRAAGSACILPPPLLTACPAAHPCTLQDDAAPRRLLPRARGGGAGLSLAAARGAVHRLCAVCRLSARTRRRVRNSTRPVPSNHTPHSPANPTTDTRWG